MNDFTFGNCGKNQGRYHYLLHIVRILFLFLQLCSGVKIEKSLTIYTIKKLKLSETKCSTIHIGKKRNKCPEVKVHKYVMKTSNKETYLI